MRPSYIDPDPIPHDRWDESYLGCFHPLNQFLDRDGESTYRLIQPLRDAARTKDPVQILSRAAEAHFFAARNAQTVLDRDAAVARGHAFADLAVTGREAYAVFSQGLDIPSLEAGTRALLGGEDPAPSDAEISSAVAQALDRAYAVAWALRGPVVRQKELRSSLGWIAVSSEDDKAHRPVNMPQPPYEQYEIGVASGGVSLLTRFFIASTDAPAAVPAPFSPRSAPTDRTPSVPADHEVLLFLHGHGSGAEEAVEIIPHLLKEGSERGKKYSIIAFDLPNNGYSQTFDHTLIAPTSQTDFPRLPTDHGPISTPILDYIEDFVVAFVDALDAVTPIKDRMTAVFGGSLGGNLGLRLGRRDSINETDTPWLKNTSIVAWNPASVWPPKVQHSIDYMAPNKCLDRCRETEGAGSRAAYFQQVYWEKEAGGLVKPQPEYWYRKDWDWKPVHISQSALARFEIYDSNYRQWHWRVAGEQLIYSHLDNQVHEDATTPIRYKSNTVRTLLVACAEDNGIGAHIYDNTVLMGGAMDDTPGRLLRVASTGHSIHFERPRFFAKRIVSFLAGKSMQVKCVKKVDGWVRSIGGTNITDGVDFRMTADDCMRAILKGDEFFVLDDDDNRADIEIKSKFAFRARVGGGLFSFYHRDPGGSNRGYHLRTVPDTTTNNNLESLPECTDM